MGPYLLGGFAILLAVAGVVLLIVYLVGGGGGGGGISLFKSKTPTPTETPTPTPVTPTSTFTMTATVTETPTITPTATASGPFEYVVQEGDNCTTIAEEYDVDVEVLLFLNNLTSSCYITVGQTILIPAPGQQMPTRTPVPTDTAPGTKIPYTVSAGDTLSDLAEEFLSDVDRIIEETNKYREEEGLDPLEDENDIKVGDILIIPVFISTPVPTVTSTTSPTMTPTP